MDVEFCNLTYTATRSRWTTKDKVSKKTILRSVSGRFKTGELTAIIGHSGAGKSSLLDILAGVRSNGIEGTLLTNGQVRDVKQFGKNSCYLAQDDLLQPLMTLREMMVFAAKLKLPVGTTTTQRDDKISEVIHMLGLEGCENTRTEMLSGGQQKRLSVGLELVTNPPLFFLDEPTSGLDIVSAKQCLGLLHTLAHQGRTIVCSIHQPSALMFNMFDHVYVMSQGVCVYQGSTTGLVSFLSASGLPCPITHNPADFVIEATDGEEPKNIELLSSSIKNGKVVWKDSPIVLLHGFGDTNQNSRKRDTELHGVTELKPSRFSFKRGKRHDVDASISTCYQLILILTRMFLQIARNRTGLWIQLVHHIMCGLLIGSLFLDRANDGTEFFIHLKCTISIVVFHAYTWMFIPILQYPIAVKVVKREYLNRWYNFTAYFVAVNISTIPLKVFFSMIFLTIVYFMWGQPPEWNRYSAFCLTGIILSIVAEGLGLTIGATFSLTNGTAIGPATLAAMLGLAIYGFDFAKTIPLWLSTLMQFSFIRGGLVAILVTIFGQNRAQLDCSDEKFGYCHFQDPAYILQMGALETNTVTFEILKLCAILLFFRVLFFVSLKLRLKN